MLAALLWLAASAWAADPTVVCDGRGGYRTEIWGREGTLLAPCFEAHERVHVADLEAACPGGCHGQPNGAAHGTGSPRCPAFERQQAYMSWLQGTECGGYAVEAACLRRLTGLLESAPGSHDLLEPAIAALRDREREVEGYRAAWGCGARTSVSSQTSPRR
jgi:hypothetical protein